MKTLMEYVGWKDVQPAMRDVDAADPFAKYRLPHPREMTAKSDTAGDVALQICFTDGRSCHFCFRKPGSFASP
jgi:hypothetical protein